MAIYEAIAAGAAEPARRAWRWLVLHGVLLVVLGVVALVAPLRTAVALAVLVGIFAIVDGVASLVAAFRYRGVVGSTMGVMVGLLTIVLGVLVLIWPDITLAVLVAAVAVWSIVVGLFGVVASVASRRLVGPAWGWGLLSGILSVAFGVLALANLRAGLVVIVWLLGVYALVLGVLVVTLGLRLRSWARREAASTGDAGWPDSG